MMNLSCKVISALKGKTLVSAESCTGGGVGAALTSVSGSSDVYKGGVVSYSNWVKQNIISVPKSLLDQYGAVSAPVAEAMAKGVRLALQADIAVSVTGLAGPTGDEFSNPVGTVFIGYDRSDRTVVKHFLFRGDRESIRTQAVQEVLRVILENENE